MEEFEFKYEYDIKLICDTGREYLYIVEADCDDDAIVVATEFLYDDYPYEIVVATEIIERRELDE